MMALVVVVLTCTLEVRARTPAVVIFNGAAPYSHCTEQLVVTLRDHWNGSIVVSEFAPMDTEMRQRLMSRLGVTVRVQPLVLQGIPSAHIWYQKLSLFLDPFYRQFESFMYLDADGTVHGKLDHYFGAAKRIVGNSFVAFGDNGSIQGKHDYYYAALETYNPPEEFKHRYPNRKMSGGANFMLVVPRNMPPVETLERRFRGLIQRYHRYFPKGDQSLLMTALYDELVIIHAPIRGHLKESIDTTEKHCVPDLCQPGIYTHARDALPLVSRTDEEYESVAERIVLAEYDCLWNTYRHDWQKKCFKFKPQP